ncbi:MAG: hypothetical protein QF552_10930 [Litorilituus sp.]|jgi:hypothetical protein|nr:hypothetical protein [Litorilituus sp.]
MMKKLIIVLGVIIAVIGGVFWFISSDQLNALIKEQIETQGHKFTEQTVAVEKVEMNILQGAGTINGLVINNPTDYSTTPLFSLNEVTIDINLASLPKVKDGGPIILDAVIISSPEAFVEFTKSGRTNIQDVLDAVNRNTSKSATQSQQTSESGKLVPNIAIKKLVLAGVTLRADLTALGNTTHKKILPDINLANIGSEKGIPASELGGTLIKKSLSAIWKSAKQEQEKIIKEQLKEKAKEKLKEKLGEKLKGKAPKLLNDLLG